MLLYTIAMLIPLIIKIAIPILIVIFLIKGIKYLNKKNKEDSNSR